MLGWIRTERWGRVGWWSEFGVFTQRQPFGHAARLCNDVIPQEEAGVVVLLRLYKDGSFSPARRWWLF